MSLAQKLAKITELERTRRDKELENFKANAAQATQTPARQATYDPPLVLIGFTKLPAEQQKEFLPKGDWTT
jgi:hypothetical protein